MGGLMGKATINEKGIIAARQKLSEKEPTTSEEVYLFISFDLVNSTDFKNTNVSWPKLIKGFYENSEYNLRTESSIDGL